MSHGSCSFIGYHKAWVWSSKVNDEISTSYRYHTFFLSIIDMPSGEEHERDAGRTVHYVLLEEGFNVKDSLWI